MGSGLIRLNLGCGSKKWPDFINVDIAPKSFRGVEPDVVADLKKLPFPDEYADEVHAIHVIEHFYVWEVGAVLNEWKRVLKAGGKIVLELPCMEKILGHFFRGQQNGGQVDLRATWWGLYGDPAYKEPYMTHHWCYSTGMMKDMLKSAQFNKIEVAEPIYHEPCRDMRLTAKK